MAWKDYAAWVSPATIPFGGRFSPKKQDPMQEAMPYLNQIDTMANEKFNPYIQQGQAAGQAAGQTYGQMAQNPADFYNDLFSKYSTSKGFEYSKDQAMKNAQNAAAQGGFSGTQYDQQQQAGLANALGSQNMQEWMQNVMGMQNTGLAGQQHMVDTGYGATGDLASMLGQNLNAKGGAAFQGAQQKNLDRNKVMQMLAQLLGTAGGAAVGGPSGAAAGYKAGSSFGG